MVFISLVLNKEDYKQLHGWWPWEPVIYLWSALGELSGPQTAQGPNSVWPKSAALRRQQTGAVNGLPELRCRWTDFLSFILNFPTSVIFDCGSSTGLGETETPLLRVQRFHVCWAPTQISHSIGSWADLPVSLGGSPGEAGVSCGLLVGGSQGHWWQRPQRILTGVRLPFRHQNLSLVNSLAAPVLECFRPNNKQDRKHSPTHHKQASWAPSYL